MSQRQRRTRAKARRHARRGAVAASAAIGLASPSVADALDFDISRVADINPTGSSTPLDFTEVNGTVFFRAYDGVNGYELWKTNGTTAGTQLVKNINSTPSPNADGYPYGLTNLNGTLLFTANDGTSGTELWKSDGTGAGTVVVKDIMPGPDTSYPGGLTNVNGTLFFVASDGVNGSELWESDGTAAGTALVKNINSTPDLAASASIGNLTNVNGTLFFSANDGTRGYELWRSDATAGGTTLVRDIALGGDSGYPGGLINVNGTLFFTANDGSTGFELWKSNGDGAGTALVKDIRPLGADSGPFVLTNVAGTLFFGANDGTHGNELWKSNGTTAGTALIADIKTGSSDGVTAPAGVYTHPIAPANVNGTLFFVANDGSNGDELWKSDGTAAGTTIVSAIRPGAAGSYAGGLTEFAGSLFFQADDGSNGGELWKSDGTVAGTGLVKDIRVGVLSSYVGAFTNIAGTLFFQASDGPSGYELWKAVAPRQLSIADVTVNEGGTVAAVTVSGAPGTTSPSFDYATADGTAAAADYTQTTGSASVPASATSTTIDVPINQDLVDEPDETFTVTISNASSPNTVLRATATVTIADDDPALPPNNFTLPKKGKGNLKKGTLTLEITLPGAGTLSAGQQGFAPKRWFAKKKALLKPTTKPAKSGKNTLVLKPSKAGLKKLKKAAKGPKTGKLKVPTTITFTPTGGTPHPENKTYKLKLK